MISEDKKALRKEMFDKMEQSLCEGKTEEESNVFYYHSSEEHVVLSHALFLVMTRTVSGRIAKEKYFLLLRQYQEEMLTAYLTEDPYFDELLRYCNILYGTLPLILTHMYDIFHDKSARRLAAITTVAVGFGGDIDDDSCYDLVDDIDFLFNRVKCRKIEAMLPQLMKLVDAEIKEMRGM